MPPPPPSPQGNQERRNAPQQPTNADIVGQLSQLQISITNQFVQHKQEVLDRSLKLEEHLNNRLTKQDDAMAESRREQVKRLDEMHVQVQQVQTAINGGINPQTGAFDPTSGLIWNMMEVKRFFTNTKRFMWLLVTVLITTVGTLVVDLVAHVSRWGK